MLRKIFAFVVSPWAVRSKVSALEHQVHCLRSELEVLRSSSRIHKSKIRSLQRAATKQRKEDKKPRKG